MAQLTNTIEDYCAEHTSVPGRPLNDIYRSVALHTANPGMSTSPYQGVLLEMLTRLVSPTVAVEVGCYAGYGAACIARGLPEGGVLHTIEANEEYEEMIMRHASMAQVRERIKLHIGQALKILPTLPDGIGLAYVDADKTNYANYYDLILPKMRPGGLLLLDNMLWYGRVVEEPKGQLRCDRSTRVIRELGAAITADPRVENILLPLCDGLMVCRVCG